MNIIILGAVDFPAGPATTSRIKHIAKILVMAGNKVTVASLQANTKIPYLDNISTEGDYDNIHYTYLSGNIVRPSGLFNAFKDTLKGSFGAFTFLLRMKKKRSVDLVLFYTPSFFVILPSLVFAKLFSIPIVLELCEIYSVGYMESFKNRIGLISANLTEIFLPRICSGIIVISSKIKEKILVSGINSDKVFHLPILVDFRKFNEISNAQIPLLADKKYFLNSGALGEKDGAKYLIDALALVCRKHEDVYLVFTGEPNYYRKKFIVDLARDLGIEEKILFTGFLSNDQLVWAYQHAIALLCCRKDGQFANYGSPTKLSEYLSTGKPVITNEVGDNKVYLTKNKNAFIARVEDCESIAEQMNLIITRPAKAVKVGKEGQLIAKDFFHYENYVTSLDTFVRASCKVS